MHRRPTLIAIRIALLCLMALPPVSAPTQTPQPITSLPKAPDATPSSQPQNSVHPITSLPKPPAPAASPDVTPPPPSLQATPPPVEAALPAAPAIEQAPAAPPPAPTSAAPPPAAAPQPPPSLDSTQLHASIPSIQSSRIVRPKKPVHAFSTLAIGVKGGFAGVGVDLATPLAKRFNLRAGGSFYSYSGSYNVDGVTINGEAKFRSGTASIDIFPFNNGFRISPGVTYYNGNNLNASAAVAPGQEFDLGDANYYSSLTDPVYGSASMTFGKRIAPSLTIGFGNMIPRSGRHFSFPFEIGIEYLGVPPMIGLYLQGTACYENPNAPGFSSLSCADMQKDTTTQTNLKQEENQINNDIKLLKFYPIISQGFAFRF